MSLKEAYKALEAIASKSGRKEKEAIFSAALADVPHFHHVVYYAYHGGMQYKIKAMAPEVQIANLELERDTTNSIFRYLEVLSTLSGVNQSKRERLALLASIDAETYEVVRRIVNKDLRCGIGLKTVRQFLPNLPVHDLMLCNNDQEPEEFLQRYPGQRYLDSFKLDGVRCWAIVHEDKGILYLSRSGKEFHNFHCFDSILHDYALALDMGFPFIFDGEVVAKKGDFQKIMTQVNRLTNVNTSELTFAILDSPSIVAPLEERLDILYEHIPFWSHEVFDGVGVLLHQSLNERLDNGATKDSLLKEALDRGFEGRVWKVADSPYVYDRSFLWCKVVPFKTVDLQVIGKEEGTGKNVGRLGALVVDFNGVECSVGSGYSDAQREEFWAEPPTMIEVEYREETKDGSMRFPRFVRVRSDKD